MVSVLSQQHSRFGKWALQKRYFEAWGRGRGMGSLANVFNGVDFVYMYDLNFCVSFFFFYKVDEGCYGLKGSVRICNMYEDVCVYTVRWLKKLIER